eukprot:jgi/Mesvir1/7028/Mv09156-RA.1
MKRKQETVSPAVVANEEDFPRGGASLLTPLEIREARKEAEKEFFAEKERGGVGKGAEGGKQRRRHEGDEGPKRKKGEGAAASDKGKRAAPFTGKEGDTLFLGLAGTSLPKHVDLLTFKSLSVGMKLWGCIAEVGDKDLTLSLPNGLRGFVPLEAAFDKMPPSDELSPSPLRSLFREGQLLPCTITGMGDSKRKGKRVELSLKLSGLQRDLSAAGVYEGMPLVACVSSNEERGYILAFGAPKASGFLPHSSAVGTLQPGQLINCLAVSTNAARGVISVRQNEADFCKAVLKENDALTLNALLPGMLVDATVAGALPEGLHLSFLSYFSGSVDRDHLPDPLSVVDPSAVFPLKQRVKARILYIDVDKRRIGLTMNPSLVAHVTPPAPLPVGSVVAATVRRVDTTVGVLLELPVTSQQKVPAYAHISNLSDTKVDKIGSLLKRGQEVQARIIGYRSIDGLANVSLKPSVVSQAFVSRSELKPGMLVKARVAKVEEFGLVLSLGESVTALCPALHVSDAATNTSRPSKTKFQVGTELQCRVLECDVSKKSVLVTHKKTLVKSTLPILSQPADAVEGIVTHGVVTGVQDYGVFVKFYGHMSGLVHRLEAGTLAEQDLEASFHVGQVVKCRVLRWDPKSNRLSLSFNTSAAAISASLAAQAAKGGDVTGLEVGAKVSAIVRHVRDASFQVDVLAEPAMEGGAAERGDTGDNNNKAGRRVLCRGVLHFAQLCDHASHVSKLQAAIKPGTQLEAVVLEIDAAKSRVFLSTKPSLLRARQSLPSSIPELHTHSVYQGYIANINEMGCFVRFLGHLTGLATISQLADTFVTDVRQHFTEGQSVRAACLEVDHQRNRFSLSLKQSVCFSTDTSFLEAYFQEERLIKSLCAADPEHVAADPTCAVDWLSLFPIGTLATGTVEEVREYGVVVNLAGREDAVAIVSKHQLPEPGSCDLSPGDDVTAVVLDVNERAGIVDLSMNADIIAGAKQRKKAAKAAATPAKEATPSSRKAAKQAAAAAMAASGSLPLNVLLSLRVELVKDEVIVLSSPQHGHAIAFAAARDFNQRVLQAHQMFHTGQTVEGVVHVVAEPSPESKAANGVSNGSQTSGRVPGRTLVLLRPSSAAEGAISHGTPKGTAGKAGEKRSTKQGPGVGSVVAAKVMRVHPTYITASITGFSHLRGWLHVTEVIDGFGDGSNPLKSLHEGQDLQAVVVNISIGAPKDVAASSADKVNRVLELSLRPSVMAAAVAAAAAGNGTVAVASEQQQPEVGKGSSKSKRKSVAEAAGSMSPFLPPPNITMASLEVGQVVVAYITKLVESWLWVSLSQHVKGRLHLVEATDDLSKVVKASHYFQPGTPLLARITAKDEAKGHVDLSARGVDPRELSAPTQGGAPAAKKQKKKAQAAAVEGGAAKLVPGTILLGQVGKVKPGSGLIVRVSGHQLGHVSVTEIADSWLDNPLAAFHEGSFVRCAVITEVLPAGSDALAGQHSAGMAGGDGGGAHPRLELSLRESLGGSGPTTSGEIGAEGAPAKGIKGPHISKLDTLKPGGEILGYVKSISTKGCFVSVAPGVDARVMLCNLSDSFVADPVKAFPPGKLVKGRVVSVDTAKGKVEMSLRLLGDAKGVSFGGKGGVQLADLRVGQVVMGTVKRVESFGVFITVENSRVDGLCHISEASDKFTEDLNSIFAVGQKVQAAIIKLDVDKKQLSFTLKSAKVKEAKAAAALAAAGKGADGSGSEDGAVDDLMEEVEAAAGGSDDDDDDEEEEEEEEDGDDDEDEDEDDDEWERLKAESKGKGKGGKGKAVDEEDEEEDEEEEEDGSDEEDKDEGSDKEESEEEEGEEDGGTKGTRVAAPVRVKKAAVGATDGKAAGPLPVKGWKGFWAANGGAEGKGGESDSDGGSDEEEEDEDEDVEGAAGAHDKKSKQAAKRARKHEKREKERRIQEAEQQRLQGDSAPRTADDYERLVMASPNSSFVWIQYMAFMLSLAEVDKARAVAERALQTIHYREEGEKLNVWVAYLNLENKFGQPPKEAVLKLFQRAVAASDPKKVHLALADLYERTQQNELAEELYKAMQRKFNTSAKVWLKHIHFLLTRGKGDAAHKVLDRSFASLPRHKHLKVISKAALMEFKVGSPDRGRGMMEGILRNYPKRLDIWSQYLDQEIRLGDHALIRALFERAICLNLSTKKMKFLFKRYLDYEKSRGDVEACEYVKQKAMEYMENKLGA